MLDNVACKSGSKVSMVQIARLVSVSKGSLYYVNVSVDASNFVTEMMPRVVSQEACFEELIRNGKGVHQKKIKDLQGRSQNQ